MLNGHQCTIWVHDEAFSKEEILFNQDAFSDAGVKSGDIIEILPIRPPGEAQREAMSREAVSRRESVSRREAGSAARAAKRR